MCFVDDGNFRLKKSLTMKLSFNDASIYQIDINVFYYFHSNIYLNFNIELKVMKNDKHNNIETWVHKEYNCLHEDM